MSKTENPGAIGCAGAGKSERLEGCSEPKYSMVAFDQEAYAVAYVAKRYRLAPTLARLLVGLAAIGGRCGA